MRLDLSPAEILVKILECLDQEDLRTCLEINRRWNKTAQSLLGEGLHVRFDSCSRKLFDDLFDSPLFASRVTKVSVASPFIYNWIELLRLCYNTLELRFETADSGFLLNKLATCGMRLPKLQEITFVNNLHFIPESCPWNCLWRYRSTITKLSIHDNCLDSHLNTGKNLYEIISSFPNLLDLEIIDYTTVDLLQVLLSGKKLQRLSIHVELISLDNKGNEDVSLSNVPNSLELLDLTSSNLSFETFRFLGVPEEQIHEGTIFLPEWPVIMVTGLPEEIE